MPCYKPLKAYRSQEKSPETGRHLITFNSTKNLIEGSSLKLPCGQCVGCRIDRSRAWAVRCMHEAQMHPENAFITLTFSNEHLPANYSISVRDWQLFAKRLRKSLPHKRIRFFACGEYGPDNLRPHYHALLFNHSFSDQILWKENKDPSKNLYVSKQLQALWPFGFSTVGLVTFQSAAYVARYVMKKMTGDLAVDYYTRRHPITGTYHVVQPEFLVQSRRPGLGASWLEAFRNDVYPSDFIVYEGRKINIPRFYELRLKEEEINKLKKDRKKQGLKHRHNNTPERLAVREEVQQRRLQLLQRNLKDHDQ